MSLSAKGSPTAFGDQVWQLPPLILHPFADQTGPSKLLEGSKAALMLCGLLPGEHLDRDELTRKLCESHYCEVRMLYFVGKDLERWVEQCVELVERDRELSVMGIREQSFSALLVDDAPEPVRRKLRAWGVGDHRLVFSRALGLNGLFRKPPQADQLTDGFLRHYHRFADHLYACAQQLTPFTEIHATNFCFELYASGEYSRMLETEWGEV